MKLNKNLPPNNYLFENFLGNHSINWLHLTLSMVGWGQFNMIFSNISRTFKRVIAQFWNFLIFLNIKNKNFEKKFELWFFPQPLWRGVLKKDLFETLVLELQNMIFRTHKKRAKSKRWPLYLKNWASNGNFLRSRYNKISLSQNF